MSLSEYQQHWMRKIRSKKPLHPSASDWIAIQGMERNGLIKFSGTEVSRYALTPKGMAELAAAESSRPDTESSKASDTP